MACNNLFGSNSCSWIILILILSCVFGDSFCCGNNNNCGCGCGCDNNFSNNNCGCGC